MLFFLKTAYSLCFSGYPNLLSDLGVPGFPITSKFEWMLDNIRIEKIILAPVLIEKIILAPILPPMFFRRFQFY